MLTWAEFGTERPDLAEAGRKLFYQFGVGLGLLGTVRRDGGPRMHPICPVIAAGGLFAFIEPSPKAKDLLRDNRYALRCFPPAGNEDAFYITGRAQHQDDPQIRATVSDVFWRERDLDEEPDEASHATLFEFFLETCLHTTTKGHGDWHPQHTIWKAQGA
jgi:hypothetical protein